MMYDAFEELRKAFAELWRAILGAFGLHLRDAGRLGTPEPDGGDDLVEP